MDPDELERKIFRIRRQNELIMQRHAEIEADKRNAEGIGDVRMDIPPDEPLVGMQGGIQNRSTGRGRRIHNVSEDSQKGREIIERASRRLQSGDAPPPDPNFNFLSDRSRTYSEGSENVEKPNVSRRHRSNFGGSDFENVRTTMQQQKSYEKMHPADPPKNKLEMSMRMTGKERSQYQQWKEEREAIDRERLARHKMPDGTFRREWDMPKMAPRTTSPQYETTDTNRAAFDDKWKDDRFSRRDSYCDSVVGDESDGGRAGRGFQNRKVVVGRGNSLRVNIKNKDDEQPVSPLDELLSDSPASENQLPSARTNKPLTGTNQRSRIKAYDNVVEERQDRFVEDTGRGRYRVFTSRSRDNPDKSNSSVLPGKEGTDDDGQWGHLKQELCDDQGWDIEQKPPDDQEWTVEQKLSNWQCGTSEQIPESSWSGWNDPSTATVKTEKKIEPADADDDEWEDCDEEEEVEDLEIEESIIEIPIESLGDVSGPGDPLQDNSMCDSGIQLECSLQADNSKAADSSGCHDDSVLKASPACEGEMVPTASTISEVSSTDKEGETCCPTEKQETHNNRDVPSSETSSQILASVEAELVQSTSDAENLRAVESSLELVQGACVAENVGPVETALNTDKIN